MNYKHTNFQLHVVATCIAEKTISGSNS